MKVFDKTLSNTQPFLYLIILPTIFFCLGWFFKNTYPNKIETTIPMFEEPANMPMPSSESTINFVGGTFSACYGSTPVHETNWTRYSSNHGLCTQVDISGCGFTQTPYLFVNTHGDGGNWLLTGGSSAYNRSATSFAIYVYHLNGTSPEVARDRGWHVQWLALAHENEWNTKMIN